MRSVRDIKILENIPVLVRAALNVPIEKGSVVDAFRMEQALETIEYLRRKRARVILIGHLTGTGTETLLPVHEAMKRYIPDIAFCRVSTGPEARAAVRALLPGQVLMLENLRRSAGEEKNDRTFAAALAELADVFVQDAFDVLHRSHASVVGVPEILPSYAGFLVEREVIELSKALSPKSPSLAIIGGAKFSTKEPVLRKLLSTYTNVYVGGALGNDFVKARGFEVGKSLVSNADSKAMKELLANPRLILSSDAYVARPGQKRDAARVSAIDAVGADESILDDGPESLERLSFVIKNAKSILWNGPLGNYENGFTDTTEGVALAVAQSKAHSVVGGGDTVAAIEKLGVEKNISFISTGGGAMLEFLAKGTLPGLRALG